jgi:hypothetical protein
MKRCGIYIKMKIMGPVKINNLKLLIQMTEESAQW